MLTDPQIKTAVSAILQRSERQPDVAKLRATFVDVGIASQLQNRNNQIVFGRRGTGKTHIFRMLEGTLSNDTSNAVLYIDARTLGSTSQFSDSGITISYRCTALFRDILSEIHNALREYLVALDSDRGNAALEQLSNLSKVATGYVEQKDDEHIASTNIEGIERNARLSGTVDSISGPKVEAAIGHSNSSSAEITRSYTIKKTDKIIFPEVRALLTEILQNAHASFYLLIDEWSSLPLDIQPYLAEFIKRTFLPNPHIIVKIAALEFRSAFNIPASGSQFTGFELGADISSTLDIDDYYVYDRNPSGVVKAFEDMLFRHISSELPSDYLNSSYGAQSPTQLCNKLFASKRAFDDLVRASEGVARDLINVFSTAFFDCGQKGRTSIHLKAIEQAARQWYEQDKVRNLDDRLRSVLSRIVDEVIGKRHARSFLVPRELEKHATIQKLFDARVLHLVCRGYADKETPGTRYNIYTLDYGTYVDLRQTSKSPEQDLFDSDLRPGQQELPLQNEDERFIVPFDDKRSIRQIILRIDILED